MAEKRKPYLKWYTRDWRSSAKLRMCSYGARGFWADIITLMAESEHFGFLIINGVAPTCKQLAGLLGGSEKEVTKLRAELGNANVYSVTGFDMPDDVKALIPEGMPAGVIFSRRMLRDKAKGDESRKNGPLGGNPNIPRGVTPKEDRHRPFRRSDAPGKTRRIFDMHGGHCHWCGGPLLFDPDGSVFGFHVDHVVAICDGGSNDEANLVPACAGCNHARARLDIVGRARQEPFDFASRVRQQPSNTEIDNRHQPVGQSDSNLHSHSHSMNESSSSNITTVAARDAAPDRSRSGPRAQQLTPSAERMKQITAARHAKIAGRA